MIRNIMRDGSVCEDLSEITVTRQEIEVIYTLAERILEVTNGNI